jgi:glycosyltransferase involved in cell wall biosynthesis
MRILLVSRNRIPVFAYGGTERVIWDLGKALNAMGHTVSYLVKPRSRCDFGEVLALDKRRPLLPQVEAAMRQTGADIAHFQSNPFPDIEVAEGFARPYVMTEHGNSDVGTWYPRNVVFIARDHARRHGSDQFVHNGLDWDGYGEVDLAARRRHFHFLGNSQWPVKNLPGAIEVALKAAVPLEVMGGKRLQFKPEFRFTWQAGIRFHGMVGGARKFALLNGSAGMIFPVVWHEPFGLAVIESLYFGCPVFATPYGAIPELVPEHCGVLSDSLGMLATALRRAFGFPGNAGDRPAARAGILATGLSRARSRQLPFAAHGRRLSREIPAGAGRQAPA